MKGFFRNSVLFTAILTFGILGGCASAAQERQDLHTKAMQQTIEANDIELSRACRQERESVIASAKYEAVSQDGTVETWRQYYRTPVCVLKEKQKREHYYHQNQKKSEGRVIWFPPQYSNRRPIDTE